MHEKYLSHYRIISKIGAGGMSEVFLAEDSLLHRQVALKLLPEALARDRDRLRRFEQEAFAVSALNHPNILTIHEFGESDGVHFLATEFVDGVTLRSHLASGELSLNDALDIAEQTAFALSAAHAAGIVHRDLKPENIMVRRDRVVKVLDFGLVKLIERHEVRLDTEADTPALVQTHPGVVLGTCSYMSPEQTRAKDTDGRTDIWSLGVVLYEMVTQCLPFDGDSTSDRIAAILTKEPPPLSHYVTGIPTELQHIVSKALRKERDDRYQSIKDLRLDLKDLRRELTVQHELERSAAAHRDVSNTCIKDEFESTLPSTTSAATSILTKFTRHRMAASAVAFLVLLVFVGSVYWLTLRNSQLAYHDIRQPFQKRTTTRVAVNGDVKEAAVSPDGRYVAYIAMDMTIQQAGLWLTQASIATSNIEVLPFGPLNLWGITFSPDGQYLYYLLNEHPMEGPSFDLYRVPSLGGDSRTLVHDVDSAVTFSPDGQQMAFYRNDPTLGEMALIVADVDGGRERKLAVRMAPLYFLNSRFSGPAWSPDGRRIAAAASNPAEGQLLAYVATFDAETGVEDQPATERFFEIGPMAWLADGSGLVVRAARLSRDYHAQQLWCVDYPSGAVRRLTDDMYNYRSVSMSRDSLTLVTVVEETESSIWVLPDGDFERARRVTSNPKFLDGWFNLSWTPDGRIVYYSRASGRHALWMMNGDGTNRKQITDDSSDNYMGIVSPDGRSIICLSERTGSQSLWRMDLDGSNPKLLVSDSVGIGVFTPDSQWFLYTRVDEDVPSTWKIPVEGGEAIRVSETNCASVHPIALPDGKLVAVCYREPGLPWALSLIPVDGGRPVKRFDVPDSVLPKIVDAGFLWAADRRAVIYSEDKINLSLWELDGASPPIPITKFSSEFILCCDLFTDGKTLAISRGSRTRDVILIKQEQ